VLYLGSTAHPVPGAVDVLTRVLQDHVPHVFVTNSTGTTEEEKASELTSMLPASSGLAIDPRAVIVATTPMRALAPSLKGKRILAVARTAAFPVQLLESYGFEREMIVPVQAYAARHPTLFPQKKYLDSSSSTSFDPSQDRIDAVFLLQTPEDWGEALQVCLDVLRSSDGVPGGSDCDLSRTQAVKVYSGNPDFDYRALHSVPRLTLGAFRKALEAFYVESTGFPLQYELYGKPFAPVVSAFRYMYDIVNTFLNNSTIWPPKSLNGNPMERLCRPSTRLVH